MRELRMHRNFALFFLVLTMVLTLFLSVNMFDVSITGSTILDEKSVEYPERYCENINFFTRRCIIQTEKELCHLENKDIVCEAVMNTRSYVDKLNTKQVKTFNDKGIPIIKNNKVEYFRPELGKRFTVDLNKVKNIHIGFTSDIFIIRDFYYGTCDEGDNCTIDVGVEIKPFDSQATLPQINDLVARWDFVEDATDTGILRKSNGTVHGATHTFERYEFDGKDDYIILDDNLTITNTSTILAWIKREDLTSWESILGVVAGGHFLAIRDWDELVIQYITNEGRKSCYSSTLILDTDWHQVGAVLYGDGTTRTKMYIDGVDVTDLAKCGIWNTSAVAFKAEFIGFGSALYTNGSIENVYVWNRSLTANEIEEVYNQTRFNTSGNTQTYSGTFTGGIIDTNNVSSNWTTLSWTTTEPAGTSVEVKYRIGNYTRINESNPSLRNLWKFNRTDSTNITANNTINGNLSLHYKFNSINDFADYSGQENNGTNNGTAYTQEGFIRGGRVFDGVDDYIVINNNITITNTSTVLVWIKRADITTWNLILGVTAGGYYLGIRDWDELIVQYATEEGRKSCYSSTLILDKEWHQVGTVLYGDGTTRTKMYIDGQDVTNLAKCGIWNTSAVAFAAEFIGFGSAIYNDGEIDNLRVYNISLNDSQVKEIYAKEAGIYDEIGSNYGREHNTTRTGGLFESNGALKFDGDTSSINVSYINVSNRSIVSWIKEVGKAWTFLVTTPATNYTGGVAGGAAHIPFNGTDIGVYVNGTFFNGTIDVLATYNKTLNANEISDLFINWSSWSNYDDNSGSILDDEGRLLQYQARLNTTNNANTPVLHSTTNLQLIQEPNLMAYYSFNNASGECDADSVFDLSGNYRDGEIIGTVNFSGTQNGNALVLNGGGYIKLPSDLGNLSDEYTITFLTRFNQGTQNDMIALGFYEGYSFEVETRNSSYFLFNQTRPIGTSARLNLFYEPNRWTFWALQFDGSKMRLYKNGEGLYLSRNMNLLGSSSLCNAIGGNRTCAAGEFNGSIDEVRIYNVSLSIEKILNISRSLNYCSNGVCDSGENYSNCPEDCLILNCINNATVKCLDFGGVDDLNGTINVTPTNTFSANFSEGGVTFRNLTSGNETNISFLAFNNNSDGLPLTNMIVEIRYKDVGNSSLVGTTDTNKIRIQSYAAFRNTSFDVVSLPGYKSDNVVVEHGLIKRSNLSLLKSVDGVYKIQLRSAANPNLPIDYVALHAVTQNNYELWEDLLANKSGFKRFDQTRTNVISKDVVWFSKNIMAPVYETTIPAADEINNSINKTIAKGETFSISFSIASLVNLTSVEVNLTNLSNSQESLPVSNISVYQVAQGLKFWNSYSLDDINRQAIGLMPDLLNKFDYINIIQNKTQRFWITIEVPETALGNYTGNITVYNNSEKLFDIPVRIDVLNFTLNLPDSQSFLYASPLMLLNSENNTKVYENIEEHQANTVVQVASAPDIEMHKNGEAGCTAVICYNLSEVENYFDVLQNQNILPREQYLVISPSRSLRVATELGVTAGTIYEQFSNKTFIDAYIILIQNLSSVGDVRGIELIFSVVDEPADDLEKRVYADRLLGIIKNNVSDERTWTTYTYPRCENNVVGTGTYAPIGTNIPGLDPLLDYKLHALTSTTNETRIDANASKFGYYTTYYSNLRNPVYNRFLAGYFAYKTTAKAVGVYAYGSYIKDPYIDFDLFWSYNLARNLPDFLLAYPTWNGDMLSTISFEGLREGITDSKYLAKLTNLTINLPLNPVAIEANRTLNNLFTGLSVNWVADYEEEGNIYGFDHIILRNLSSTNNQSDYGVFDDIRANLTEYILQLLTFCGNGICEMNYSENVTNCPEDCDVDRDLIIDPKDPLIGNKSFVTTNLVNFSIEVNGSSNLGQNFTGVLVVLFNETNLPSVEFLWNFSLNKLKLNWINVSKLFNGSFGAISVSGLNLSNQSGKSLYVDIVLNSGRVCVEDVENVTVANLSNTCDDVNEFLIDCPGTSGKYVCSLSQGKYKIDNLDYSAAGESNAAAAAAGAAGGGGTPEVVNYSSIPVNEIPGVREFPGGASIMGEELEEGVGPGEGGVPAAGKAFFFGVETTANWAVVFYVSATFAILFFILIIIQIKNKYKRKKWRRRK